MKFIKHLSKGQWFGIHIMLFITMMILDGLIGFLPKGWDILILLWSLFPWIVYVQWKFKPNGKIFFWFDVIVGLPVGVVVSLCILGKIPMEPIDSYFWYYIAVYLLVIIVCRTFKKEENEQNTYR